jgi:hypothetical protein
MKRWFYGSMDQRTYGYMDIWNLRILWILWINESMDVRIEESLGQCSNAPMDAWI